MRALIVNLGGIVVVVSLCLGCSDNNPWNRQEVTGTVTFNGQPCAFGSLTLMPSSNGNTMAGGIIRDGKFTIVAKKGLSPGEYGVSISIRDPRWDPNSPGEPKDVAPLEWGAKSTHKVTVTEGGPNTFEFAVENPDFEKIPVMTKD